jgi:hypothetical protein
MDFFYSITVAVSLTLQAVLLVFLLRHFSRTYFIVFLYSLAYLLTNLVETIVRRQLGKASPLYARVYWTDEIILDLLLFLMVILLTYQATEGSVLRGPVGKMLSVVVLIAVALPFVFGGRPYFTNHWFNFASQILNFGGAVMNLGLWTALIGSKRKDAQLLAVSSGVGIAVTGQALYYGLRLMTASPVFLNISEVINATTFIAGFAIWCWAFWPRERALSGQGRVATNP